MAPSPCVYSDPHFGSFLTQTQRSVAGSVISTVSKLVVPKYVLDPIVSSGGVPVVCSITIGVVVFLKGINACCVK